jgi:uncharacterized protein YbjT (DUF2867 family)
VAPAIVTVFGATGFLGRRIVRRLHEHGYAVRIASRHPGQARALFGTNDPRLRPIDGDIRSGQSVADAIAGARGVVNAVSLYVEHGKETFHAVHVEGAQRVAVEARRLGVEQLVHISGIGADAQSPSPYIRSRGQGELAVRTAYPGAILVRPTVMFGPDDAFLTVILKLLQRLPAYPIFGSGTTKLQPAHVDDVAEAVARIVQRAEQDPIILECGGHTVASAELPGFRDLDIVPQRLEETHWPAQRSSCQAHRSREIRSSSCVRAPRKSVRMIALLSQPPWRWAQPCGLRASSGNRRL